MPLPEPLRGEVWDVEFADFGRHPALVLSVNPLNSRLGHVAVVPVIGTRGPALTHIALGADAGLTKYDESFADVTVVQPVARVSLVRMRGRLDLRELEDLHRKVTAVPGFLEPTGSTGRRAEGARRSSTAEATRNCSCHR